MWVNEEGLLKKMPTNELASMIAGQHIVGPVVVFTNSDVDDDWSNPYGTEDLQVQSDE
jgi:hypothetical protein